MKIQLSDHFTYKKLIWFVTPSIIMMIFTSVYSIVDGFFVSNYVGKTPFAALNLIYPLLMMLSAVGFMIGTGGSAIVSKTLGEGDRQKANEYFSLLIYTSVVIGIIISTFGFIFLKPIAQAMGADGEMLEYCLLYGRILLVSLTFFMLQTTFQTLFVTAEKPALGLIITLCAGFTNIILDFLFIAVFKFGLAGAAAATAFSQFIGGFVPLIYFSRKNNSLLRLTKTKFYKRVLLKTCTNGSSELMTNLSMSLLNMIYNVRLMKLAGENGVAAYGVIMYVSFIFTSIFIGYSIGSAPVFGYNYGAQNHKELKNMFKKSMIIMSISGVILTVTAILLSPQLADIFVGYDKELLEMTENGLKLFSTSFLLASFNIFASAFFTALNNGFVSAAISFSRTLLFQIAAVMLLPLILGLDGIWLAVTAAEILAIIVSAIFFITNKKKYKY